MRHIEINSDDKSLFITEGETPSLSSGQVLIEVAFAGVNRPDLFQRAGAYPPPPGASPILGLEVSGRVTGVASDVTDWKVGDYVCALTNGGGYATHVAVPSDQCLPIPEGLDLDAAAALPETCFTVWSTVFMRAGLQAGESLLVHGGASGIGSTAIQMAKAKGCRVFTTVGSTEKADFCHQLGADHVINYRDQDFVDEIKMITEGKGVNVILDMVGGDYLQKNMKAASVEGRIVSIAFLRGAKTQLNMQPVMVKRLTLTGATLRPQSDAQKSIIAGQLKQQIWPLIEQGVIKPAIHKVYDWSDIESAHELMGSNGVLGKLVLKVS